MIQPRNLEDIPYCKACNTASKPKRKGSKGKKSVPKSKRRPWECDSDDDDDDEPLLGDGIMKVP